jgi:glyoxylase-like metal-dependent hydrolase (beta-lactamase superfamily II)
MALQVADKWYGHAALEDGIVHIWEPHVSPLCRCNIWYVRGRDQDLLIDSGSGAASLLQAVSAITEKRTLAVATHSHFDHIGSHHEFRRRAIHAAEADIMSRPTRENTLAEGYANLSMFRALPHAGFEPDELKVVPAPPTQLLAEGDVIDLGDRAIEVLHLPGHTDGSLGFWEAATGTLFSGDAVYDGPLFDDLFNSSVEDYIATMERIRALPARVVHGGHFNSFNRERLLVLVDEYLAGKRAPGCPTEVASTAARR